MDPKDTKRNAGRRTPQTPPENAPSVVLLQLAAPPKFQKPKRIHPRRRLPLIDEGFERQFHSMSTRAILAPAAGGADDLRLVVNSELLRPGEQRTASNVGEPSCAINGNVVFYTGNWYASVSTDGGKTFGFVDPQSTQKPTDLPNRFCCDQVVHYIESIDTFVWLLQYGNPDDRDNIQRLGFIKSADIAAGNLRFRFFDLTTALLGVPGAFMDFPDIAVGGNSLYVTTNIFLPNEVGSAVFRLPLAGIANGPITTDVYVSMQLQSFRVAQNCGTTAYFAAHQDTSTLQVFSWREGDAAPTSQPVGVARWIGGNAGYRSRTPDGRRWLDRADSRLTGATMANNELWFAWAVDRGSNHRERPFVQIARINANNMALLENINVFDPDSATCYGALSSNARNEVGISYMIGGAVFPSHVVGILTGASRHVVAAEGERSPLSDSDGTFQWGDYLTVRRVPGGNLFAATGYTLKGKVDGDNLDATPRFVVFGRASDAGGGSIPPGGGGGGEEPVVINPITEGAGPITDVSLLPTVTPSVAAQIKAACGMFLPPHDDFAEEALPPLAPKKVTAPGKERWPVKVGTDDDVALVGKNIIGSKNLGRGIVEATVEELIAIPRPTGMTQVSKDPPGFLRKRGRPTELVIWRVDVTITAMKLEDDGDYHLVMQGVSGDMMIGEVPTPTKTFLGKSPWLANIKEVREAVDNKLVSKLSPHDFVPLGTTLVPREAVSPELRSVMREAARNMTLPQSFAFAGEDFETGMPTFRTKVKPTDARVTG
ncbi:MAG: hypothetical protein QOJ98_2329, partial [Acidobacteriota bacterium]|nr:hypothetical protein [Acidobacteriota bacterium]